MKSTTLKCNPFIPSDIKFYIYYHHMMQIMNETVKHMGIKSWYLMPLLSILCVCENVDTFISNQICFIENMSQSNELHKFIQLYL